MSVLRKIGYSFVGLLAGDGALLACITWSTRDLEHNPWQLLKIFCLYAIFTVLGWIVVGVPAVLLMDIAFIRRIHWPLVLLIGAVLGPLALFLIFLVLDILNGQFSLAGYWDDAALSCALAMVVSLVAFAVYCIFMRRAQTPMKTAHR